MKEVVKCPNCQGTGEVYCYGACGCLECDYCKGSGRILYDDERAERLGDKYPYAKCDYCGEVIMRRSAPVFNEAYICIDCLNDRREESS